MNQSVSRNEPVHELIKICFEVSLPLCHSKDLNLTALVFNLTALAFKDECVTRIHHMTTDQDK